MATGKSAFGWAICVALVTASFPASAAHRGARPRGPASHEDARGPAKTGPSSDRPPGPAARQDVIWDVTIASREKRPELEKFLRQVIEQHARRANWGARRKEPILARFEVTEFSSVLGKDVARVTCTGIGKLKGGQSVRSHFSMGGRPAGRAELERQLLTMLGRGIVNRLAEIARGSRSAS